MVDDHMHYCNRCGEEYDWYNVEPPEGATIYWEPHCPACNAKMTETAVDKTWLRICNNFDTFQLTDEEKREKIQKIHYQARLLHGRLCGVSREKLIDMAKYFDSKIIRTPARGASSYRDIAFRLRQQARNAP